MCSFYEKNPALNEVCVTLGEGVSTQGVSSTKEQWAWAHLGYDIWLHNGCQGQDSGIKNTTHHKYPLSTLLVHYFSFQHRYV